MVISINKNILLIKTSVEKIMIFLHFHLEFAFLDIAKLNFNDE